MLAEGMAQALGDADHVADRVSDGAKALLRLSEQAYDLLVLDLDLPQVSGTGVLDALERSGDELPVLVVTAHDCGAELAARLVRHAGAYLRKPFALVEFEARVRMLVRTDGPDASATVRSGRLVLEPAVRRVTCDGVAIELSEREFALLHVLVTAPGQLAARERIAAAYAGGDAALGDNAIDVYVHRLRRKLEPHGLRVSTVRGLGYCLHDDNGMKAARP